MIFEAYKQEQETRLWQQYLTIYPNMDPEHFTSFEDYKAESQEKKTDKKETTKEILEKAERIKHMDTKRKEVKNANI